MTASDPEREGVRGSGPDGTAPDRAELLRVLGVTIDSELLTRALTHRSYANENGGLPTNERLGFLGDSVLGAVIASELFLSHDVPEGLLSRMRAVLVRGSALAGLALSLGIGPHILLGRGELTSGGARKTALLGNTMEALIGAVYLEHGYEQASAMVLRLFAERIERAASLGAAMDWKTSLQRLAASRHLGEPFYKTTEEGPDHQKTFRATVLVGGITYGPSEDCRKKKEAEAIAAGIAYLAITDTDAEDPAASGPAADGEAG